MFKKEDGKINQETAEQEFERFCDDWELDSDVSAMSEEEKEDFAGLKSKIVRAIKKGRLSFDDGKLNYTISDKSENKSGEKLVISRPKGHTYMDMDKHKDREGVHKTYTVLAGMTGKSARYFSGLDGIDLKPLFAVVTIFLAS